MNQQSKNNMKMRLKEFYNSSRAYLSRLERHDKEIFASYLRLCKAKIPAGASILDCGCGIGTSSYLLAREGFKVTGIDISSLFISEARKKYSNQLNLRFCVADAAELPFPDQSFDAVCSYDLLEHVTDVKGVLREMCRVLKIKGVLIVFMPNHLDPIQHLIACIRWRPRDKYKPWEAKSRIGAFSQFVKTTYLSIMKAIGVNKKIYNLEPVLSDDENVCGEDFDATWLSNWFDIENILKDFGFSIECIYLQDFEDRVMKIMRMIKLPKTLQLFYTKLRKRCVIVGIKK